MRLRHFHQPAKPSTHEAIHETQCADLEVFFDGDCPLCRREIEWLRRRDRRHRVRFIDFASQDYPEAHYGKSRDELARVLHARHPGGGWITGVEVFRQMYSLVGRGWLLTWTRWPGCRWLVERGYAWFARNRLRLTGRRCEDGACRVGE
ncbi:MAG: thiol-disulfide oxidoreductase DCC family protein [Planctomycetota bacterium]